MLSAKEFIRVSNSHIVRIDKIKSIPGNFLKIIDANENIPIGDTYKKSLLERLNLKKE